MSEHDLEHGYTYPNVSDDSRPFFVTIGYAEKKAHQDGSC